MHSPPAFAFGVILLAAGKSSRMGAPKLLLPWGETSVLGHLIRLWHNLGATQVAVVAAAGDSTLAAELARLYFPSENRLENPQPDRGMFSSILCAARWSGWRPGLARWAVVLGDQPHIGAPTLRQFIAFAADHPTAICQPAFHGRAKHPVLLPARLFQQLAKSSALTLAEFIQAHPPVCCEIPDPALDLDLDTPQDYEKLLSLFPPTPP